MAITSDDLSQALSNLALIQDDQPIHTSGIPNKVEVLRTLLENDQTEEAFYMLATFCFDVSKRFAMLCHAVSNVYVTGTPSKDLAALIANDDQALNNASVTTWADRASIAGAQLGQWHSRVDSANQLYRTKALNG